MRICSIDFPSVTRTRSRLQPVASLKPGRSASIAARVLKFGVRSTRRMGFKVFEALIADESGPLRAVWLNQPFLGDVFASGQRVVFYGVVEARAGAGLQLTNPQFEILEDEEDDTIHTRRIVPVYERVGAVTPRIQRRILYDVLQRLPDEVPDHVPEELRLGLRLAERRAALVGSHFPPVDAPIDDLNTFATPAQRRMIFEEAFLFQTGVLARRHAAVAELKPATVCVDDRIRQSARRVLPFRLTGGQKQALKEIVDDLQRPQPMNRLLQGDVGAGKTIVALLAALVAMENGLQVAFMAPTEILAEQHFLSISRLLQPSRFRVALLTGATSARGRRRQLAEVEGGSLHLVVGTHALVQGDVRFRQLGLVIIDEQHRFGVMQRATLRSKGLCPDVLVMTATPIPRTLALTMYGDLEVSVIRDMPPGRLPIKTVATSELRRDEIYAFVRSQLEKGHQAYVVYPLVEKSDRIDLKAATEMADQLAQVVFPTHRVGLLHGRLRADAKARVMKAFVGGELHLLVSTTVVEVGVDVANATVLLVEHAERFGLPQLHQLRGRVGRGDAQSFCFLLYQSPPSDEAQTRLKAMTDTTDGFEIAERDLRLRGPGEFFGTRQAGMPAFRLVDLIRDRDLLDAAGREAARWFESAAPAPQTLDRLLLRWGDRFRLMEIG